MLRAMIVWLAMTPWVSVAAAASPDLASSLTNGRRAADSLLSLIYRRFEMDTALGSDFFHVSHNIGKDSWDALKYKFAKKIADAHLGNGEAQNSDFIYVFGGSSVTAGHDNFYRESYPKVFERRLQPVFDALRVGLSVRNIAIGSVGCEPYNACYEALSGTADPDFVTWEQSYFCKASPSTEALARYAASSRSHAVMAFLSSGSPPMHDCTAKSTEAVPYCDEKWSPSLAGLDEWKPSEAEVAAERLRMDAFHQAAATGGGFSRYLSSYQNSIKQYGLEFWQNNPKASTSRKNGDSIMSSCELKFATAEALRHGSGHGMGSHPTVAKHLMRAELIAWVHGMIILDAIYMVHKDFERLKSVSVLSQDYTRKLDAMYPHALPAPVLCEKTALHCPHKVQCYSNFLPHFHAKFHLSDIVVGKLEWEVLEKGELSARWISLGYNDTKWHYKSNSATARLNLKVSVGAAGVVQVCLMDGSAEPDFYVDLLVPNPGPDYEPPAGAEKWAGVQREGTGCGKGKKPEHLGVELFGLPPGDHVISVANEDVKITAVLMWPE